MAASIDQDGYLDDREKTCYVCIFHGRKSTVIPFNYKTSPHSRHICVEMPDSVNLDAYGRYYKKKFYEYCICLFIIII